MRATGKTKEELFAMNATAPSNDALSALQADTVMMFNVINLIFLELSSPQLEIILRQQISFTTTEPDEIRNVCYDGCLGRHQQVVDALCERKQHPSRCHALHSGKSKSRYAGVAYRQQCVDQDILPP